MQAEGDHLHDSVQAIFCRLRSASELASNLLRLSALTTSAHAAADGFLPSAGSHAENAETISSALGTLSGFAMHAAIEARCAATDLDAIVETLGHDLEEPRLLAHSFASGRSLISASCKYSKPFSWLRPLLLYFARRCVATYSVSAASRFVVVPM